MRWGLPGMVAAVALMLPASAGAATITPTTTSDDFFGATGMDPTTCSLREALQTAYQDADAGACTHTGTFISGGADTIQLGPGPYFLQRNPADGAGSPFL